MNGIPQTRGAAVRAVALVRTVLQALALLTVVASCARTFAPAYDPAFLAGFNETNTNTFVLLNALAGGSGAGAFGEFAPQYDSVIGAFEALKLRAEAREAPPLPPEIAARIPESCADPAACAVNPTPANLAGVISNLALLRNRHGAEGLTPGYVELRKLDHEIYAANILVVEEYLRR